MEEFYPELRVNLGAKSETFDFVSRPQSRSPPLWRNTLQSNDCNKHKVKVYVRMRPFTEAEKVCPLKQVLCLIGETIVVREVDLPHQKLSGSKDHKLTERIEFKVDYMQDDSYLQVQSEPHKEESQKRMYAALGVPCVESALEGYNTTILAYGQTGSGKTYTMMGDRSKGGAGLIPRLAYDLMTKIHDETSNHGVLYTVQVSYLEIYQEKIRDLLAADEEEEEEAKSQQAPVTPASPWETSGGGTSTPKIRIRRSKQAEAKVLILSSHTENSYTNSYFNKAAMQRQSEASHQSNKPATRTPTETGKSPLVFLMNNQEGAASSRVLKSPKTKPVFDTVFNRQKVHKHYRTFPTVMEEAVPAKKQNFLKIREHPITGPFVEGLLWKDVCDWSDMESLMKQGSTSRTTAATDMNAQSSRSHAVFAIRLTRKLGPDLFGVQPSSVNYINLVDLAGSEKLPKLCSGAVTGQRTLEESRCINRSLSQLNEVILSLAKSSFVSYRNSVLTWLLKESLGGNSRTYMVANISPTEKDLRESINSLRYATTATRIQSPATLDQDPRNKLIKKLKEEISTLRNVLSSYTTVSENAQLPSMQGFKVPCLDVGLQVECSCSHDDDNVGKMSTRFSDESCQTEHRIADGGKRTSSRLCGSADGGVRMSLKKSRKEEMGLQTKVGDCGDSGHQVTSRDSIQTPLRDCEAVGNKTALRAGGVFDVGNQIALNSDSRAVVIGNRIAVRDIEAAKSSGGVDDGCHSTFGTVNAGIQKTPRTWGKPGNARKHNTMQMKGVVVDERKGITLRDLGASGVADVGELSSRGWGEIEAVFHTIPEDRGAKDAGDQTSNDAFIPVDGSHRGDWRECGFSDAGHQVTLQHCSHVVDFGCQVSWVGFQGSHSRQKICSSDSKSSAAVGHQVMHENCRGFDTGQTSTLKELGIVECFSTEIGPVANNHQAACKNSQVMDSRHQKDQPDLAAQVTAQGFGLTHLERGNAQAHPGIISEVELQGFCIYGGVVDAGFQTDWICLLTSDAGHQTPWTDIGTAHTDNQVTTSNCTSDTGQQISRTDTGAPGVICEDVDIGQQTHCDPQIPFHISEQNNHDSRKQQTENNTGSESQHQGEFTYSISVAHQITPTGLQAVDSGSQAVLKVSEFKDSVSQVGCADCRGVEFSQQTSYQDCGAVSTYQQVDWKDFGRADISLQSGHQVRGFKDTHSQGGWTDFIAVEFGQQTSLQDSGVVDGQQQVNFQDFGVVDVGLQTCSNFTGLRDTDSQLQWIDFIGMEFGHQTDLEGCATMDVNQQVHFQDFGVTDVGLQTGWKISELKARDSQAGWTDFMAVEFGQQTSLQDFVAVGFAQQVNFKDFGLIDVSLQTSLKGGEFKVKGSHAGWTNFVGVEFGHQTGFQNFGAGEVAQQVNLKDFEVSAASLQTDLKVSRGKDVDSQVGWTDLTAVEFGQQASLQGCGAAGVEQQVNSKDFGIVDTCLQTSLETKGHKDIKVQVGWTDLNAVEFGHQASLQGCGAADVEQQVNSKDFGITDTCLQISLKMRGHKDIDLQVGWTDLIALEFGHQASLQDCWAAGVEHQVTSQDLADIYPQTGLKGVGLKDTGSQFSCADFKGVEFGRPTSFQSCAGVEQRVNFKDFEIAHACLQTSLNVGALKDTGSQVERVVDLTAVEFGQQTSFQDFGEADTGLQCGREISKGREGNSEVHCMDTGYGDIGGLVAFKESGPASAGHPSTRKNFKSPSTADKLPVDAWKRFQCGVCGASPSNSMMVVSTMLPIREPAADGLQTGWTEYCDDAGELHIPLGTGWGALSDVDPYTPNLFTDVDPSGEQHPCLWHQGGASEYSYETDLKDCKALDIHDEWLLGTIRAADGEPHNHHWKAKTNSNVDCQNFEPDFGAKKWQLPAPEFVEQDGTAHDWQGGREIVLSEPSYLLTGSDDPNTSDTDEETSWNANFSQDVSSKQVRASTVRQQLNSKEVLAQHVGIQACSGDIIRVENAEQETSYWPWKHIMLSHHRIEDPSDRDSAVQNWKREDDRASIADEENNWSDAQTEFKVGDEETVGTSSQTQLIQGDKCRACNFSQQTDSQCSEDFHDEKADDIGEERKESCSYSFDGRLGGREQKSDCLSWSSGFIRENKAATVPTEDAIYLCSLWILAELSSRMQWNSRHSEENRLSCEIPLAKCQSRIILTADVASQKDLHSVDKLFLTADVASQKDLMSVGRELSTADAACQKDLVSVDKMFSTADVAGQKDLASEDADAISHHTTNLSALVLHLCYLWCFVKMRIDATDEVSSSVERKNESVVTVAGSEPIKSMNLALSNAAADGRSSFRRTRERRPPGLKQLHYSGVEPVTFKSSTPFFIQTSGDCSLVRTSRSGNTGGLSFYKIMCGFQSRRVVHFLKDGVNRLGSNMGAHLYVKGLSEDHTEFIYMPAHRCAQKKGYVVARLVASGAQAFLNGLPMLEHKQLRTGDVLVLRDLSFRSSVCTLHFFDLVKVS